MKKYKYSKNDFSPAALPVTRKALFFDVYRNNMKVLTKCGLFLFLFSIPALLFLIFMFLGYMGITPKNFGEDYEYMVMVWNVVTPSGFLILAFPILVGVSGVIRVLRQLVWQEGVDFKHEFKSGVKQNFKYNLVITLIMMFLFVLSDASLLFLNGIIAAYVPMIIFLLVFLPIYIWFILLVNIYSAPFKTYFKNSIYFYIKTIGWSILFGVLVELPFVIDLIPFQVNPLYISIKYSAIIALIFFYYPALFTILLLYSNSKFDIAINKDLYPEYYRKGLYDLNQKG